MRPCAREAFDRNGSLKTGGKPARFGLLSLVFTERRGCPCLRTTERTTFVKPARMSIPFGVATALMKGSADIDDFGVSAIRDQSLLNLVGKVSVHEDGELTRQYPSKRMAIVTVFTKEKTYREVVSFPKGQPENPMTIGEIIQKFYECGHYAGMPESSLKVVEQVVLTESECQVLRFMSSLSI